MEGLRGDTIRPACARDEKALDDLELVRVQDVEARALLEQEETFAQHLEKSLRPAGGSVNGRGGRDAEALPTRTHLHHQVS